MSEQHSVGQDVSVVAGRGVVVTTGAGVVTPLHEIEHCLSQHCSPEPQSASVLQSEHWQFVLVSHSASPSGQLFAPHVASQLWQPTLLAKSQTGPTGTVYLQIGFD